MISFDPEKKELEIKVLAVPRASKTEIKGEHDGHLRVRVAAPPVEGAANEALVVFFAKLLGVPKTTIEIVSGSASRRKTVRVHGVEPSAATEVRARLDQ